MDNNLLAVYGTLKRGFGNNRLLSTSEFIGEDIIETDMTMISMGGFPGLVETPGTKNKIHIEVFKPDSEETKKRIDSLEGHPGWYKKKEITTAFGPANVYYFSENEYSITENNIIRDGNWKRNY